MFAPTALRQLRTLRTFDRAKIKDAIENILQYQPAATSKSRIKKLRQPAPAEYRLRVGELRVFYKVDESLRLVEILLVISKAQAKEWLSRGSEENDD